MKLSELHPLLKRSVHELGFIPVLTEVFNTEFDSVKWSEDGGRMVADCSLGDEQFKLIIEVQSIRLDKELVWLNIAFARVVHGVETETLIGSDSQQSRALGAVINALKHKIATLDAKYSIDALTFIAVSDELKRLSLYRRILQSRVYGLHPAGWRELTMEIDSPGGRAIVLVKERADAARVEALRAELAKHGKTLI